MRSLLRRGRLHRLGSSTSRSTLQAARRSHGGLRAGAVALAVAALVSGCGEPPELRFGAAQPSGEKLDLPSGGRSGLPGEQWPDACELVDDAELKAILPQAEKIERERQSLTLHKVDFLGGGFDTEEIPAAGCQIDLRLPDDYDGVNTFITFSMRQIADPSVIREEYREDRGRDRDETQSLGTSWGADECHAEKSGLRSVYCRLGQYYFEIRGRGPSSRITEQDFTDKVLSQIVQTVTARMR
ncbi:hypothetical protein ABGB12_01995 [Actinocorallia sp. B10E7]|uniref:hypothetical protein n=1 Tax=Actinocorallia sp. B10E7 TaxID=3153558 RepID=UPI00325ECB4A